MVRRLSWTTVNGNYHGMKLTFTMLTTAVLVAACNATPAPPTPGTSSWASQTSAGGGGGMDKLVAAARSEGQLNLIALPRDWANYGAIIDAFKSKYGIKVTVADPNGNSQDEVDAVTKLGKSQSAPDVLDLSLKFAMANPTLFSPYQVEVWGDIPTAQKNSIGLWYEDYGGYMSIGFDSAKVPAITVVDDLLKPDYKGKVALKADPAVDTSALGAIVMISLAEGGSLDDIGPGVDFFHQLKLKGNFLSTAHATMTTVKAGQTPVVLDWEYLSRAHTTDVSTWKVVVPADAVVGGYYAQAISKYAPHPAAARLWEEFVYSDDGQNLWLRAGDRPVRMRAMQDAGHIDAAAAAAMPSVLGSPMFLTPDQEAAALRYLSTHWAKAIS